MDLRADSDGGGNPTTGSQVVRNLSSQRAVPRVSRPGLPSGRRRSSDAFVGSSTSGDNDPTAAVNEGLWAISPPECQGCRSRDDRRRGCPLARDVEPARPAWSPRCGWNALLSPDFAGAFQDRPRGTPRWRWADERAVGWTLGVQPDPRDAPTGPVRFPAANARLGSFPTPASPALGPLQRPVSAWASCPMGSNGIFGPAHRFCGLDRGLREILATGVIQHDRRARTGEMSESATRRVV